MMYKSTPGRVLERDVCALCRKCLNLRHYMGRKFFKRYYCELLIYSMLNKQTCSGLREKEVR